MANYEIINADHDLLINKGKWIGCEYAAYYRYIAVKYEGNLYIVEPKVKAVGSKEKCTYTVKKVTY